MEIPNFLDRDNYLQNPIMRRFLKYHNLEFVDNRADYIKAIEEFASQNEDNQKETEEWLLKVVKEGSKDICYRKIHGISSWHKDPLLVEAKIKEAYPDCPGQSVLTYKNTENSTMIEYHICTNEEGEVEKIDFTFSQLLLFGEVGNIGEVTIFPVFIEIYLNYGFAISRGKAKSTLFKYDANNHFLIADDKVDTMDYAINILDQIIGTFGFETETNKKKVKTEVAKMMYKVYDKYSFTPPDVENKINSQNELVREFVNKLFTNLGLDIRNKERAILDANILVEKYISINGDNVDIFKDRPAYLIKVSSDDEVELTSIDTTSDKTVPLQCTEAFFDSKKSVMKSKTCKKLNLIFRRNDDTYFPKINPLVVQLGTNKNYGYIKTMQYAEEADIQDVLQTIFNSY